MPASAMPDATEYLRAAATAADDWRRHRDELAAVLASGLAAGVTTGQLARATRLEVRGVLQLAGEHRAMFADV